MTSYLTEPRGILKGRAAAVLRPGSTAEVAEVIRAAAEARVGVVPYGGGTGLVGAQLATEGPAPLVLSLERMTRLRGVYPEENVIVAEARMTLAEVQAAAEDADRLFPLSLASEGTARIGGNLSTNAGGVQVLRYGNARELCLGLEAVLPDGRVWNGLKRLRKDNTGYDLRGLLVGAEGTLGVITAASLRLFPRSGAVASAYIAVPGVREALTLLALGQDRLGPGLTAFELISAQGPEFLVETGVPHRFPLDHRPAWAVLVEVALPKGMDAQASMEGMLEAAAEAGLVSDGVIAQSEGQRTELWTLRESIPEANRRVGAIASHDVSLPLSEIARFIEQGQAVIARFGDFRINCFGHMGDGNLHYNVFPQRGRSRDEFRHLAPAISDALHDLAASLGGSFSAEHGGGRMKVGTLERLGDPVKLDAMRAIKAALDPLGIMNPGAVLMV